MNAQSTGYHSDNAASECTNAEENRWFQQETDTALANLEVVTNVDCTTLASVTAALATANANIASLKRKLKMHSNPVDKYKNIYKHGNYFWEHVF